MSRSLMVCYTVNTICLEFYFAGLLLKHIQELFLMAIWFCYNFESLSKIWVEILIYFIIHNKILLLNWSPNLLHFTVYLIPGSYKRSYSRGTRRYILLMPYHLNHHCVAHENIIMLIPTNKKNGTIVFALKLPFIWTHTVSSYVFEITAKTTVKSCVLNLN